MPPFTRLLDLIQNTQQLATIWTWKVISVSLSPLEAFESRTLMQRHPQALRPAILGTIQDRSLLSQQSLPLSAVAKSH